MKDLKFPEPIEVTIKDLDLTIKVKPYLTSEEIDSIVTQMTSIEDSYVLRDNVRDTLIIRYCTDIDVFDNDEIETKLIDLYRVNGIIDKVKDNIDKKYLDIIEYYVITDSDSAGTQLKGIRKDLNAVLGSLSDTLAKVDLNGITSSFEGNIASLKEIANNGITN